MKALALALFLIATPVLAQQTPLPDITASQTNASLDIMDYKSKLEKNVTDLWTNIVGLQSVTANLPQDRANIITLQQTVAQMQLDYAAAIKRIAALEAKIGTTTGQPPAQVLPIQVEAEAAVNIDPTVVQSNADTDHGQKIVMGTTGQRFNYIVNVLTPGNYTVAARLCTDAGATGTPSLHFEVGGVNVSGPLGGLSNGLWVTYTSQQIFNLPAGANNVTLVVDSVPTTAHFYANWSLFTYTILSAGNILIGGDGPMLAGVVIK